MRRLACDHIGASAGGGSGLIRVPCLSPHRPSRRFRARRGARRCRLHARLAAFNTLRLPVAHWRRIVLASVTRRPGGSGIAGLRALRPRRTLRQHTCRALRAKQSTVPLALRRLRRGRIHRGWDTHGPAIRPAVALTLQLLQVAPGCTVEFGRARGDHRRRVAGLLALIARVRPMRSVRWVRWMRPVDRRARVITATVVATSWPVIAIRVAVAVTQAERPAGAVIERVNYKNE